MMKVGLIDVDGKMPNLALMKLSAMHKALGDSVEWFDPMFSKCDRVYASKVFTFTKDYEYMPEGVIRGGTGYSCNVDIDVPANGCPDYDLCGAGYSMGFLTRGCPNKCSWCIVPQKEGDIRPESDIEDFLRHDRCVLLDNNVLASEWGLQQIEKMCKLRVKVDFNQGLDARRIDAAVAKLLGRVRWFPPIRLACDSAAMMKPVEKAVGLLRAAGATPRRYSCYVLVKDVADALERVTFLDKMGLDPFAQPYRDFDNNVEPTREQLDFARWVNHKATFRSVAWKDYKYNPRLSVRAERA